MTLTDAQRARLTPAEVAMVEAAETFDRTKAESIVAFRAAANPAAVLALCATIAELRIELELAREEFDAVYCVNEECCRGHADKALFIARRDFARALAPRAGEGE